MSERSRAKYIARKLKVNYQKSLQWCRQIDPKVLFETMRETGLNRKEAELLIVKELYA